jgi:Tfp pilus assembly protein FimT
LVTVAILGIVIIFVLPQVIYWLTGVNLSATGAEVRFGSMGEEGSTKLCD